jgi:hypothetical protein
LSICHFINHLKFAWGQIEAFESNNSLSLFLSRYPV